MLLVYALTGGIAVMVGVTTLRYTNGRAWVRAGGRLVAVVTLPSWGRCANALLVREPFIISVKPYWRTDPWMGQWPCLIDLRATFDAVRITEGADSARVVYRRRRNWWPNQCWDETILDVTPVHVRMWQALLVGSHAP
jgi:hypothetical protein